MRPGKCNHISTAREDLDPHCGDGFECGHHVGWFRVERGGDAR